MYTLDSLTSAIKEYTENDEVTFVTHIPEFIRLAEERILKASQLQDFIKTDTQKVEAKVGMVLKPADWLATYDVSAKACNSLVYLQNKDKSYVRSYWPDPNEFGTPRYYADEDLKHIIVAPTPAVVYEVQFRYLHRPVSLVNVPAGESTWIATNAPQTLLYACLIEAYVYMKGAQDMIVAYDARFNESIIRLKNHGEALEPDDAYKKSIIRSDPK